MRPRDTDGFLGQRRGLIFLGVVFVVFLQAGLYTGHTNEPSTKSWSADVVSFGSARPLEHPIPTFMMEAEENFRKKLSKQSKTLAQAVSEYKRRYHRDPPRGFDQWWDFVQKNGFKLVDEFDGVVEDLAPFWELSGEELRRRALQVGLLPSIDLVRVENGKAEAVNMYKGSDQPEVSARAKGFLEMIEKFQDRLPDMDFPINAKSEGRILVPWEHRKYQNITIQDSSEGIERMLGGPFKPDWQGEGNVWDAFRRTCPPASSARRLFASIRNTFTQQVRNFLAPTAISAAGDDFNFSDGTEATYDFCSEPWAHTEHGHFFSDWRTIPVLYPVFSPGKAPGFLDIRIPSHYYYGSTPRYTYGWDAVNLELKNVDDSEVPWEEKDEHIFWRGATTGGGNSPQGFASHYQRHRFVRMASDDSDANRTVTFADPPNAASYLSTDVSLAALNEETMDVAFVSAVDPQNYPGGLDAMTRVHRFADPVMLGHWWKYKYLLDLDGNGYSGRFMAFMASDSAVVKSSVYKEYYADWIEPWLHYIPLSSSYKEIYNIHAFFSGPTPSTLLAANASALALPPSERRVIDGDRRLRRIARAGKQWKKTIARQVDMEVYVYRLALEYARLRADDRDSMSFKL